MAKALLLLSPLSPHVIKIPFHPCSPCKIDCVLKWYQLSKLILKEQGTFLSNLHQNCGKKLWIHPLSLQLAGERTGFVFICVLCTVFIIEMVIFNVLGWVLFSKIRFTLLPREGDILIIFIAFIKVIQTLYFMRSEACSEFLLKSLLFFSPP